MRIYRYTVLFLLLVFFSIESVAKKSSINRIVVFTPTSKNNTYWPQVNSIMRLTAQNLNVKIELHEFDVSDRFAKSVEGMKILRQNPKPSGAIFCVAFGQTRPLLSVTEELGIPVFIQGPVFKSELKEIGNVPRKRYKSWIGYFFDNEEEKGYQLGRLLIRKAEKEGKFSKDGRIHVIGIGGDYSWFGSKLREDGLRKAVREEPKAVLKQIVPTLWSAEEGETKCAQLLKRYPETTVVWGASDQLALGASSALKDAGKTPGKDVFIGGLDLSIKGLNGIREGRLNATVSGTLFTYSEMLIYLVDYIHNMDFLNETGSVFESKVYTATMENAYYYQNLYRNYNKIEYKLLSKTYNKKLKQYDFSLSNFRAAMKK